MCHPKSYGGMGFHDLKARNLSLLAKQGWRILTNPESLLSKVFKARYFEQTNFMEAGLGSRPSYIWRSILEGRKLLQLGIRYQIGTGQHVKVWEDPWIPLPYTFKPNQFNKSKWPNGFVIDFILPDTNSWNQSLLEQIFFPYEVQSILQIPLCVNSVQDQITWHHTSNGKFTVKSGYITYKKHQEAFEGCSSRDTENSGNSIWNKLWKWPVQPKIRHFIWCAMHNILPLGDNLSRRGITSIFCPHCCCKEETDKHTFYECQFAGKIWSQIGLSHLWTKSVSTSFYSLATRIMQQEDENIVSLFFIITWLIWKCRCAKIFEHKNMLQKDIISMAYSLLNECSTNRESFIDEPIFPAKWCKPKEDMVSINVDAGAAQDGKASFGVLIRDPEGQLLTAQSGPLQNYISVEHAELLAMHHGLCLAHDMNFRKVNLITDSKLAFNRMTEGRKDGSLLSPLVQQIRNLSNHFDEVSYGFVRRAGNEPAHRLAKLGLHINCNLNWGSMPPYDVMLAVISDSVDANE